MKITFAIASTFALALAACGGGGTPATQEPVGNTDPAAGATPAAGVPAVDTQAFLAMLDDPSTWERAIDPAAGVAELRYVSSARDDAETEKWVKKLCRADAQTQVAAIKARIPQDPEYYAPECSAGVGGDVTCFQKGMAEYDLIYSFDFQPNGAGGYTLTGVATSDVGTDTEALEVDYNMLRTTKTGC
jgi:hypothetical protein